MTLADSELTISALIVRENEPLVMATDAMTSRKTRPAQDEPKIPSLGIGYASMTLDTWHLTTEGDSTTPDPCAFHVSTARWLHRQAGFIKPSTAIRGAHSPEVGHVKDGTDYGD